MEEFRSSYGLAPNYRQKLTAGPLEVTAVGPDDEDRAIELSDHPFFVATFCRSFRRILAWRCGRDKTMTVATRAPLTGCIWA
jgi:hypothetical protein